MKKLPNQVVLMIYLLKSLEVFVDLVVHKKWDVQKNCQCPIIFQKRYSFFKARKRKAR